MGDPRDHARYSASSYYRWSVCHGSVRLCEAAPTPQESIYAQRGTLAHEWLELMLHMRVRGGYGPDPAKRNRLTASVDGDIMRSVGEAEEYIYEILDAHPDAQVWLEERNALPVDADAWGTTDVAIFVPSTGTLHIIDYKNGVDPVEVVGNGQLRFYGTGMLFKLRQHVIRSIVLTIIQPNAFHKDGPIRSEEVNPLDLLLFLADVEENIAKCEAPDAALVPGPKQCRWCPAATTCPALQAKALSVVGDDFNGVDVRTLTASKIPEPRTLGLDRIAYILQAAPLLKSWLKEVESYAYEIARSGTPVPGFKLVASRPRRKWEGDEQKIAQDLAALAGLDPSSFYKPSLIGITEAEALVVDAAKASAPKGKKKEHAQKAKEFFAFCTTKDSSGTLSLVPLSDDRPAVSAVVNDFGGVSLPTVEIAALQSSIKKD